jgi:hypothetical protein
MRDIPSPEQILLVTRSHASVSFPDPGQPGAMRTQKCQLSEAAAKSTELVEETLISAIFATLTPQFHMFPKILPVFDPAL